MTSDYSAIALPLIGAIMFGVSIYALLVTRPGRDDRLDDVYTTISRRLNRNRSLFLVLLVPLVLFSLESGVSMVLAATWQERALRGVLLFAGLVGSVLLLRVKRWDKQGRADES
jgi:hypothetical protein